MTTRRMSDITGVRSGTDGVPDETAPDRAAPGEAAPDRAAPDGAAPGEAATDRAAPDGAVTRRGPGEAVAERDAEAVSRWVEDFVFALIQMGFPRMPARVFVALITTDSGRLTAAELSDTLQASAAAVSGAVRYLIQLGLIRREGEPGSRRHYYRVPDNWWDDLLSARDSLMGRWTAVMREGAGILGTATPAGARIAESARYFEFLATEVPQVMRRWRERKAELDGGPADDR
jgi:predicted transcriptional regulator